VTEQRFARLGWLRVGLLGCCIAAASMALTSCAHGAPAQPGPASAGPGAIAGPPGHPSQTGGRARAVRVRILAVRDQFTACEQRIERAHDGVPTMAVVGASYTAGVGPGSPALSWAADLARNLRWDAVIYGVSGAGYVRTGTYGQGPMTRMLTDERLPGLAPSLVIVQAGYDDGRVPSDIERQQVLRTVELIRAQAPQAKIGLVTVFTSPARPIPARFYQTDATIVGAARAADPNAIIMDPLTGQWTYQHAGDSLHPTAAGDAWIAAKVGAILHAHGIASHPATTAGGAPIVCDAGVAGTMHDSDARA
jgi:lysophospholipase L1-like esterase